MAGLGFKDFTVGEVLTAGDVDGYLMQQSVMRFADSAARGSALGTAVGAGTALAEGMLSWLDSANQVQAFDGSVWRPVANILQVQQAVKTDTFTRNVANYAYVDIPDLSVTVTPYSATSKFLLLGQVSWGKVYGANANATIAFRFAGGNSGNYVGDADGSRTRAVFGHRMVSAFDFTAQLWSGSLMYLDAPATASAITYKIQASGYQTFYINATPNNADDNAREHVGASSLTVIEVAG